MFIAALTVVAALVSVVPLVQAARDGWMRTWQGSDPTAEGRFARWAFRGLGLPIVLWIGWNTVALIGPAWGLVPMVPAFRGSLSLVVLASAGWGVFWVTLIWAGFTFGWLLPKVIQGIRERDEFDSLASLLGMVVVVLLLLSAWMRNLGLAALILSGSAALLFHWAVPMVYQPSPSYARAIGRIKRGRYDEAEQEVLRQLEEKSDDYEGWMMLATLYAEQFGQLAEAEQTVLELCEQPGLSPFDVARALTKLSEWQLNKGDNPVAARATLALIIQKFPGTPSARVAEGRMRQLPVDDAELRERRKPRVVRLGGLNHEVKAEPATSGSAVVTRMDSQNEVATLKARLEMRPEDLATRLRLARVLAERLGQFDAGLTQLRQFRNDPTASPAQRAEALAVEASWRLKLMPDEPEARRLLGQLVAEFPGSPQAMSALRQLDMLDHPETYRTEPPPPPAAPRIVIRLATPSPTEPSPTSPETGTGEAPATATDSHPSSRSGAPTSEPPA
ncbi:MAG: hypothetical protein J0M24_19440 [Verrucomicrobia bacterium]|nr:hypothetical protein [Verrucomicrobiota bacterium]